MLESRGIEPEVFDYTKEGLTAGTVRQLLERLKLEPEDMLRKRDPLYTELRVGSTPRTRAEMVKLIVENPALLERPIVVKGEKAVIARPPERALEVLGL